MVLVGPNTMEFRLQGDAHAHTVIGERMYVRLVLIQPGSQSGHSGSATTECWIIIT
jgi:hypothetical protein